MTKFPWNGKTGFLRNVLLIGSFLLVGGVIYSNTFHSPFVFDDGPSITRNPTIKNLENFFGRSTGYDKYPTRFLGYATFALNYRVGELDPLWYHVVNLAIHIVNSLLVCFIAYFTFHTPFLKNSDYEETSKISAVIAGTLFLIHPVQTEAVTFIVQRLTSLATMFCLISLLFYIKSVSLLNDMKLKHYAYYGLSLISCMAAMKTKEISFTFPAMLFLYEFMFFERTLKRRVFLLSPFFLTFLIIPLSLIDFLAPMEKVLSDVGATMRVQTDMPRLDYFITQISVIATYVRLLFVPIHQNLDYDYPTYHSIFHPRVFISGLFLLAFVGVAVWLYLRSRKNASAGLRVVSFGIIWFFIMLSVESSLIPIVDVIFEHRVYLPSFGAFLSFAVAVSLISWRRQRRVWAGALILIMAVLSVATYKRNTIWRDDLALWSDTVEKSPLKARPHYNLGNSFYLRGRTKEALKEFRTAIQVNPEYADAYLNLGVAYASLGVEDGAERALRKAIQLKPYDAESYYNLGLLYSNRKMGHLAIEQYKKAVSLNPESANIHNNLGIALAEAGRIDEAIHQFLRGLRFHPEDRELRKNLENAYKLKHSIN